MNISVGTQMLNELRFILTLERRLKRSYIRATNVCVTLSSIQ